METSTLYLTGAVTSTMVNHPRPDLGAMLQPGGGAGSAQKALAFMPWACDNACFALGDRFDAGDWLEWLASLRRFRANCLFAVAPDVVGDAAATLERARPYLPTIRQLGFPAAFVAQDGIERTEVPWADLDALFVGGSTEFKLSEVAFAAAREAKRRGKWAHMGRVNSLRRLKAASAALFDSADGTFVAFGPDRRLPEVYDWLDQVNGQLALEGVHGPGAA